MSWYDFPRPPFPEAITTVSVRLCFWVYLERLSEPPSGQEKEGRRELGRKDLQVDISKP